MTPERSANRGCNSTAPISTFRRPASIAREVDEIVDQVPEISSVPGDAMQDVALRRLERAEGVIEQEIDVASTTLTGVRSSCDTLARNSSFLTRLPHPVGSSPQACGLPIDEVRTAIDEVGANARHDGCSSRAGEGRGVRRDRRTAGEHERAGTGQDARPGDDRLQAQAPGEQQAAAVTITIDGAIGTGISRGDSAA